MARHSSSKPKGGASRRSRAVARSSERVGVDGNSVRVGLEKRKSTEMREIARTQRVYSRFLGVSSGETDEQVILEACSRIAKLIAERTPFNPSEVIVRSRSEVALATYRMLDPRRRCSLRQRAQLSRPINREDRIAELFGGSQRFRSSLWEMTERSVCKASKQSEVGGGAAGVLGSPMASAESASAESASAESSSAESASAELGGVESEQGSVLEASGIWIDPSVIKRAISEGAGDCVLVDSNLDSKAWLEERRDVIRALQRVDEGYSKVKRQEKSTLSWLLSVFVR
jgi:hypothetical protein